MTNRTIPASGYGYSQKAFNALRKSMQRKVEAVSLITLQKAGYYGLNPLEEGHEPQALDMLNHVKELYYYGRTLFPVYSGHNDKTIYLNPHINLLARAWHDLVHIDLQAEFNLQGDINCAVTQCMQLLRYADAPAEAKMLWYDVAGQAFYFDKHGEFPQDQCGFVHRCMDAGKMMLEKE
jgi:hypothetical protein